MKTYQEKLLDPRWQRKRLELFDRDNWTCLACGATKRTLHIHHISYFLQLEPWEYPGEYYKTVCYKCHKKVHFPEPELPRNYEHLIITKEEPVEIKSIDKQIGELMNSLKNNVEEELMTEILKKIMFLQQQKKELAI